MSDMVKRVGRAIWLKLGSAELDECEEAARAAIEAMRDPPESMFDDCFVNTTLSGGDERSCVEFVSNENKRDFWQDMIDEALKPHKDC